jgi:hypothetical protein
MIRSIVDFHRGLFALPRRVQSWVAMLASVNVIAPLIFIETREAQIVLATFVASFAIMVALTAWRGFTRLLGLGHVLWVPLLIVLWSRLPEHHASSAVGLWLRAVILLNAASLVIDAVDIGRYLAGEKRALVALPDKVLGDSRG